MDNNTPMSEIINKLHEQLKVARCEIKNLRQQVVNLKYKHNSDVDEIKNTLKEFPHKKVNEPNGSCKCEFPSFHSIGKIESWFTEKRGIPRQGAVCKESQGVIIISSSTINNPIFALSGLEEYSHIWVIYNFHKTDSNHIRTKVAPPRLNGERVGVFGTRSPHRPCPIGLSLVKLDKIVDNKIYFSGVDMMDGTPVLDIKPYIPQYDNPISMFSSCERQVLGGQNDEASIGASFVDEDTTESREAPDGEETGVRIPSWIQKASLKQLKVEFSKDSLSQLTELSEEDHIRNTIIKVLQQDPRSVYLKGKLGSQCYTFSISDLLVSCKFDDTNDTVTVFQVQPREQLCECGTPKWQCPTHCN